MTRATNTTARRKRAAPRVAHPGARTRWGRLETCLRGLRQQGWWPKVYVEKITAIYGDLEAALHAHGELELFARLFGVEYTEEWVRAEAIKALGAGAVEHEPRCPSRDGRNCRCVVRAMRLAVSPPLAGRRRQRPDVQATIYHHSISGMRAELTTECPGSRYGVHYGVPVLRVAEAGAEADYGPRDRLPNRLLAEDFVRACVFARRLPGGAGGGRLAPDTKRARRMAMAWLAGT